MERISTGLLLLCLTMLAGCATTTSPGLGEDAGATALPTGLSLLRSDDTECPADIQLGNGVRGELAQLRVERGQNATFEVTATDGNVEWACLEEGFPDSAVMECPAETTHVRITRDAAGREVLFECYG